MSNLLFDTQRCTLCRTCVEKCPFGSLSVGKSQIIADETCRMCGVCVKICPEKALTFTQAPIHDPSVKEQYQGILVYAQQELGQIHPITLELLGEAKRLAKTAQEKVYVIIVGGEGTCENGKSLLDYGVEEVFAYEHPQLKGFHGDCFTDIVADSIAQHKPSIVLVGGTPVGRSLAPRLSARFRTGLTADCTQLALRENSDLVQIRPAFGGNIMAQILITNSRPQFATIRQQVMEPAQKEACPSGKLTSVPVSEEMIRSRIKVLSVVERPLSDSIDKEEILLVAGRGMKSPQGIALVEELAQALGGQICFTRPMVESGLGSPERQVGLSGRTVRPKLLLTFGVSGSIQFVSGMKGSETVIAVNTDPSAPMFQVANYGIVGDGMTIIPELLAEIKAHQGQEKEGR